jgi:putative hemolysin
VNQIQIRESIRRVVSRPAQYTVRLARDAGEIRAAQTLRFQVFNLELNEGLAQSYATGRDEDPFDAVCDHLLVEHLPSQQIVGTYRLQTGANAAKNLGYYSAQEFEFDVFEPLRNEIVELGRACVHRQHRNLIVLGLLWRGIADYATGHGARYLLGCSSITSQDAAVGASAYTELCPKNMWWKSPGKPGRGRNLIVRLTVWRKNRSPFLNCCAPTFPLARRFAVRLPWTADLKRLIF